MERDVTDGRKPLAGLRVIQFPGATTLYLGRMLADLGADVAVVRATAPDECVAPTYAAAFSSGTRRIGEDEAADALAQADVALADRPDVTPELADPSARRARYPRLILVTVTPFGASGPFAGRPSSDLVTIAMSGYLNMTGPAGGAPLKTTAPALSARHACNHALAGLLLALRRRRQHGEGTHVDVAARETGLWMLTHTYQYWEMEGVNLTRKGAARDGGAAGRSIPSLFRCKDGLVVWMLLSGRLAIGSIDRLVAWMAEEGAAPEWLRALDWETLELPSQAEVDHFLAPFAAFFLTKTRAELFDGALRLGFMLAPVNPVAEMLDDPQLAARAIWVERELDGRMVRLPARPVQIHGVDWSPAPEPTAVRAKT
jgi:benzylsuccinate CoA-transferase BbsE subunit